MCGLIFSPKCIQLNIVNSCNLKTTMKHRISTVGAFDDFNLLLVCSCVECLVA